jgi:hypothetical protein
MWTTHIDIPRPSKVEMLRERLRGTSSPLQILFTDRGDIRFTWRSHAVDAATATSEALDHLHKLEMEIERRLGSYKIATTASTIGPGLPELVGLAEAAAVIKVSKSRVSQLSRNSDFPAPVANLAMGPVYLRSAIQAYADNRPRRGPAFTPMSDDPPRPAERQDGGS